MSSASPDFFFFIRLLRSTFWVCHFFSHFIPIYFGFLSGGILGSVSRAEFPVSLSNHVGFTPRLLYSSTHHSPENVTSIYFFRRDFDPLLSYCKVLFFLSSKYICKNFPIIIFQPF